MPEVLTIEIQDKGNAATSTGPPRAPAAPTAPTPAATPAPAPSVLAPASKDLRENIDLDEAFGITTKPQAPAAAAPPVAAAPVPVLPPQPVTTAPLAGQPAGGGTIEPLVKQGFQHTERLLVQIAKNTARGPAQQQASSGQSQAPQSPRVPQNPRVAAPGIPPIRAPQAAARTPVVAPPAASAPGAASAASAAPAASAAGVSLAGIAAAAAPVAAAFAAVYAAVQVTKTAFQTAGAAAEAAGQQLSMMARNNYVGMFTSGLDAATKGLSKIPIVGGLLGSAMGAATAGVKAFASVTEAFTQRAHELAGFSPAIMQAEMRQSMRGLFDDIREAQQLGPDLARMLDAETNLQHDLRELFLPIKKVVVELLADVLGKAQDWMPMVRDALVSLLEASKVIIGILDGISIGILHGAAEKVQGALSVMIEELKKIKFNTDKKEEFNDIYLADLFKDRDWNFGDVANPWADVEGDPRPRIPLVEAFAGL